MIGFGTFGSGSKGVIVLNDWLSDTSTWDGVRPYLDHEQFTWAFADLRGYGRSREVDGSFTLAEAASDVIALSERLGWLSFSVVGHSMSALVALLLAQTHPGRVERVILVTPSPPQSFQFDDGIVKELQDGAAGDDAQRLALLQRMQGDRLSEGWIKFKLERWRATAAPEAVAAYAPIWAAQGLPDLQTKISAPLLAITGEADREDMRGDAMLLALRPLAHDVQVAPLANCGHCPMQEMPPLLATTVERFLTGAVPSAR